MVLQRIMCEYSFSSRSFNVWGSLFFLSVVEPKIFLSLKFIIVYKKDVLWSGSTGDIFGNMIFILPRNGK